MRPHAAHWLILGLFLAAAAYAVAEEMTLTTYYPSPRGVYDQLRTMGETLLAQTSGNVGIGSAAAPGARLHVTRPDDAGPVLRLDDQADDLTPLVVDQTGNVGIGTANPTAKLDVNGGSVRVGQLNADPSGGQNGMIYYNTASNAFRGFRNGAWQDLIAPQTLMGFCSKRCDDGGCTCQPGVLKAPAFCGPGLDGEDCFCPEGYTRVYTGSERGQYPGMPVEFWNLYMHACYKN